MTGLYSYRKQTDEWVVTYDKTKIIARIPTWYRNAKSIAMFLADSANRNKKLELTPEI